MTQDIKKFEIIEWIRPLTRFGGQFEIKEIDDYTIHLYLYTEKNKYSIRFRFPSPNDNTSYIGCQSSSRKPRAGETWTRGRDLHDGKLTFDNWVRVMADILAMEAVNLQCDKSKIFNIDYWDRTPGLLKPQAVEKSPAITTSGGGGSKLKQDPGSPPWEGLVWDEPTHRWRNPMNTPPGTGPYDRKE